MLAVLLLIGLALPSVAFASTYQMVTSSTSYSPISGGTTIASGSQTAGTVSIPFTFRFFGQSYTSVSVGTSGYISFSGLASGTSPELDGTAPIIAGWWDYMDMPVGLSTLTYQVNGSAPSRDLVIQWQNADDYFDETFEDSYTDYNFQIHLHESGQIDLVYGSMGSSFGGDTNATAGIADGQGHAVFALSCATSTGECFQNNWPTSTIVSFISPPDLTVSDVTSAGIAYPNSASSASVTVYNQGGEDATSFIVRFYLSTDQVLGNADDVDIGDVPLPSLAEQTQQVVSVRFNVGNLNPGTYYLFAVADATNVISEQDENNNASPPSRLDIAQPAPDLSVPTVTASTHAGNPGEAFTVNFTIRNNSSVASGPCHYGVYLSSNSVISSSDEQLATGDIPALDGGSGDGGFVDLDIQANVTVPSDVAPGSYYVGVVADPNEELIESNELNNSGADPIAFVVSTTTLTLVKPANGQLPATSVGAVYGYQFQASGGDGHYTFSSQGTLPPGLSLSTSGSLSGRPSAASDTPYSFTVKVADGSGHNDQATVTLSVTTSQLPLTLITHDLDEGDYDVPYRTTLSATGGTPPYQWSLTSQGKLPAGLQLASDGTIEGVPLEAGSFTFTPQVTDSAASPATVTGVLTLTVAEPTALRAANPNLPDATLDQPYEVVLGVAGGTPGYSYFIPYCDPSDSACVPVTRLPDVPTDPIPPPSQTLPPGLYFSCSQDGSQGLLSSTPPSRTGPCPNNSIPADAPTVPKLAGTYAISAMIRDSAQPVPNQIKVVYTIKIGFGAGLSISTTALPDALTNKPYAFSLEAVSPQSTTPIHWSIACSERDTQNQPVNPCPENLPQGLTLTDSGQITGKVSDTSTKTYTFLARAADEEGRVSVQALSITTREPTTPPKASGCASTPGGGGEALPTVAALLALGFAFTLGRRRKQTSSIIPAVVLLLAVSLTSACGKKVPNTKCTDVNCAAGLACDPADGQCKCGGEGGLICRADQTCQVSTRSCISATVNCATVTCSNDTTCDPNDGQCKCGGQGGVVCQTSERCDPGSRQCVAQQSCGNVTCPDNEVCDSADGLCKCNGNVCPAGQACTDGKNCTPSACSGVHCVGGTLCDPTDGLCKCNGSLCGAGESCQCPPLPDGGVPPAVDGGAACATSALLCSSISKCAGVTCTNSTTCDPADGLCKCGGPGGSVCAANQACEIITGACLGGDRCQGVTCPAGSSCDPEDGQCKCGGVGGQICTTAEQCFNFPSGYACRIPCDTNEQNCPVPLACYFDQLAGVTTGYCATPGTKDDSGSPPQTCAGPTDCKPTYNCYPLGGTQYPGYCHRYCELPLSATNPGCAGLTTCDVLNSPAPGSYGQCCPDDNTVVNHCGS